MRNPILKSLSLMGMALMMTSPAWAEHHEGHKDGHHGEWHEKMKDMSPEERKAFMEERKAKWEAMSTEEKVKLIEEKRAERRKAMDEKWEAMSDEEKVEHVEDKMERHKDRMKKWKHKDKPDAETPTED